MALEIRLEVSGVIRLRKQAPLVTERSPILNSSQGKKVNGTHIVHHPIPLAESLRKLVAQEVIRGLADSIIRLRALCIVQGRNAIRSILPRHTAPRTAQVPSETTCPTHPDCSPGLRLGRALEHRKEQLGQQERTENVRLELKFHALCALGSRGRYHHAGIVVQPVQFCLAAHEVLGGAFDRGEIGEVEMQIFQSALG